MPISEARRFLNEELLPRWAKQFEPNDLVYDIGVSKWDYRKFFDCKYYTVDRDEKRKPDLLHNYELELISYELERVNGIVLNGVFEQSDDPFKLMKNIHSMLVPGGKLLAGLIGIEAPWTSNRDKWRVTKAGALEYCKAFHIDEFYELPGYYYVVGTKK